MFDGPGILTEFVFFLMAETCKHNVCQKAGPIYQLSTYTSLRQARGRGKDFMENGFPGRMLGESL